MTSPVVLCYGSPFDGMQLVGPFPDSEAAAAYAEDTRDIRNDHWHTVPLAPPLEPEAGPARVIGARATCRRCGDDIDAGDRFCSRQCKREHTNANGGDPADVFFAHPGQYPVDDATPDGDTLPSGWYHEAVAGPFPTREAAAEHYRATPTAHP